MSKLGTVWCAFAMEKKRYADGSVYEGDVEQATQTKALGVHDAGMSRIQVLRAIALVM